MNKRKRNKQLLKLKAAVVPEQHPPQDKHQLVKPQLQKKSHLPLADLREVNLAIREKKLKRKSKKSLRKSKKKIRKKRSNKFNNK